MNKCEGCGVILQHEVKENEGYIRSDAKNQTICERCFRIKNYNDYKRVSKTNEEFYHILDTIKESNDLVVLVVDLFHMNQNIENIIKHCGKQIILAFTKRDLIPLSVADEKLKMYSEVLGINPLKTILLSSTKNIGLDELYEAINEYKSSQNVYIVGYTNAGKSTLINQLIYHYSNVERTLTTSMLSSTTLNTVEIPLTDDLTIIDTPGILEEGNICEQVEIGILKKILPKKEVKPITYQIHNKQYIWIEDICMIEAEDHNLTLYFSNQLKIDRYYQNKNDISKLEKHIIRAKETEDIVILGLGFIKCTKDDVVTIYTLPNVHVYKRKSLI